MRTHVLRVAQPTSKMMRQTQRHHRQTDASAPHPPPPHVDPEARGSPSRPNTTRRLQAGRGSRLPSFLWSPMVLTVSPEGRAAGSLEQREAGGVGAVGREPS